ncbi:MAG: short-chain dehydrogenase [Arcobacter sp.]|nr:MAG: short-chain dehydrogenase [Arcobacter sp.]
MEKTILITGCSSGIGYDTAHYLHKHGYRVFASARKAEDVQRLQNEGLDAYLLDVTKPQTIKQTLEAILKKTDGKLYAVFNNAGYGQPGAVEDIPTEVLREQFETNLFGLHEMTRQIIPIMRKQGYGRIIQHSSVLGIVALRFRGAYNASKYAIEGLCDTLRLELMNDDIHVITINTGPIHTDFRKNATKKFYEHIHKKPTVFEEEYEKELIPHEEAKKKDPFTRNSNVVIANIMKALEKDKPRPRYYNTSATHFLGGLKRILPTAILDKILLKI